MSEEKRSPSGILRRMLDERGINWWTDKYYRDTNTCWRVGDFEWRASEQKDGKLLIGCTCVKYLTPDKAIAATVGTSTDLSKRLREVYGLHAFAELFGFDWHDESDWSWHDVACAMADAVDVATVGEEHEMHVCKRCGVAYELNIIDKGFGKSRFCPNCRRRIEGE